MYSCQALAVLPSATVQVDDAWHRLHPLVVLHSNEMQSLEDAHQARHRLNVHPDENLSSFLPAHALVSNFVKDACLMYRL